VCGCGTFEAIKLIIDTITALSAADVHLLVWMLLILFFILCVHELRTLDT